MGKFEVGRPKQGARLRSWPAGRAAELRLMISRLEDAVNNSLGAKIKQSEKRAYNPEIPFIIDFEVTAGFRQFEIQFPLPPGVGGTGRGSGRLGYATHPDRQLLFYEIQHDSTSAFADPTIVETAQNHIVIGGAGLAETRYFRARVVNTKFQVSQWTDTTSATTAQGRIITANIKDVSDRLVNPVGEWQTIMSRSYTAINGAVCAQSQLSVGACQTDSGTYKSGPGIVQFRWMLDIGDGDGFREWGDRTAMAACPGNTQTKTGRAPLAFGTFISPFCYPEDNTSIRVLLQAKKRPGSWWNGGDGSGSKQVADPMIFSRNAKLLEVLEEY